MRAKALPQFGLGCPQEQLILVSVFWAQKAVHIAWALLLLLLLCGLPLMGLEVAHDTTQVVVLSPTRAPVDWKTRGLQGSNWVTFTCQSCTLPPEPGLWARK